LPPTAVVILSQPICEDPSILVTLESRQIEMAIEGHGSPTVVLESGFGSTLDSWQPVRDRISMFTRVAAYNRAGVGRSEAVSPPRTAATTARDLRTMLRTSSIEPPYLLVGHSVGSFYVRVFAHEYPDDVSGLVFVDPAAGTRRVSPTLAGLP
jgi:pimeloyl-ACP methyl ester carboxylesterase